MKPSNWICRIFGHTEGTQTIFPDGVMRCTNHKCWRCKAPVPKEFRSEFVTLQRIRWKD